VEKGAGVTGGKIGEKKLKDEEEEVQDTSRGRRVVVRFI
jgi:hypothetical protein